MYGQAEQFSHFYTALTSDLFLVMSVITNVFMLCGIAAMLWARMG